MIPQTEVTRARNWALNHFTRAYVMFPDSESMKVIPQIFGKPAGITIDYKLSLNGNLVWENITTGFGNNLPDLTVRYGIDL